MTIAQKLAAFLTVILSGLHVPVSASDDPFTFLNIPIRGAIGVDVNVEGVTQAIALAISQDYDAITLELDSSSGDVDTGINIAGLFREAANHIRTIAILRHAGGPALPIAFACQEWIVLEQTGEEGPERTVLKASPTWSPTPDGVSAQLAALSNICTRISPVKSDFERRAREVLIIALTNPEMDILVTAKNDGSHSICAAPVWRKDDDGGTRIPMASRGPGIDANGLVAAGVAKMVPEGLAHLGRALGVEQIEAQGDSGLVLVGTAANEQFKKRGQLGALIDSAFSTIDGIDSLSSGMPWTLKQARLADPLAQWRLWRYTLEVKENTWVFAPSGIKQWRTASNNAIRRWMGVETISKELSGLLKRLESLRENLNTVTAGSLDRARLNAATKMLDFYMPSLKEVVEKFAPLADEARRHITELEQSLDAPPTIPVSKEVRLP